MWVLSVTVCLGEWSGRWWSGVGYIQWRLAAWTLVNRQRRSRVGRWLRQWSHSIAEQSATATTHHHWQDTLSSQAAAAIAIILQWTDVTTVRRTQCWGVRAWRHLSIQSTLRLSDWLMLQSDSLYWYTGWCKKVSLAYGFSKSCTKMCQ